MRFSMIYLTLSFCLATSHVYGKIAFDSYRDGNGEIYVMNSSGGGQTRLTHNEMADNLPAWSPNGRQIVFQSERDGNWEVYVMDTNGGNEKNLTQHPAIDGSPTWSPNGVYIAFTSNRDGKLNIYVMDADGGSVKQLTHLEFAADPKWSPDGSQIAFDGVVNQRQQVYAVNADGTNLWQVSEPIAGAVMLCEGWSPDGKQILYGAAMGGLVTDATVLIATLDIAKRKTVKHEQVPLPQMDLARTAWGADGKSILITVRKAGEKWDIYRFRLSDGQLIQLTNHPASDGSPNEWNPRLSVSPLGLVPKRWGEIKSNSHRQRGNGGNPIPPIP